MIEKLPGLAVVDHSDGFGHVSIGFFDVFQDAHLESLSLWIVFFLAAIAACVSEKFLRFVQAAYPGKMRINRRVIADIFSVIDGGALDFADGVINFGDGHFFLLPQFAAVGALQQAARKSQIRKRVEICGMFSLSADLQRDRHNQCHNKYQ